MQGDMMMPFIHANARFQRVRKLVTTELRPAVITAFSYPIRWLTDLSPQAVTEYFNPIQTAEVHRLVHV